MNKLSFFYKPAQVYKLTLKALQRRHFSIIESNEQSGHIRASITKGFLKPGIELEVQINKEGDEQTSLNIVSRLQKAWLTPDNYNESVEKKFINTLYNCFNKI